MTMSGLWSTDVLHPQLNDHGGTAWYHPPTDKNTKNKAVQCQQNFGSSTVSEWRRWDPSEHLTHWSTPQLIIHNSKDYRVPIANGLNAFNVLQAQGIESQLLTFPDENHWVLKPENSLVWHKVVLNWINKYAGLPPFTTEDPESEAFWGGTRGEEEEEGEEE